MVDSAIKIKQADKKYGNMLADISVKSPKSGGISIMPRLQQASCVPTIDAETRLPKNTGVRYIILGKVGPFPKPIINSATPLKAGGIGKKRVAIAIAVIE